MERKTLPPTYFITALALLIGAHFIMPIASLIPSPYNYIGAALVLFGLIMNIWADGLFKRVNTTVKPFERPDALVTSGPFCISRHPMYCGMAAVLLGAAILLGSAVSFVFPLAFVALMEMKFITIEEKSMSERFGEQYTSYRKKVRRWI